MATKRNPIPLTILTGFLGAGKTTMLNRILRADHGLKVAVLVNDFGSINIDSQLIVGVEGETVSLSNGCICCTIREDLLKETVKLLRRDDPPEYIIVETSGVSDPATVAETFMLPELTPYLNLDSILTVIDADQVLSLQGEMADLAHDQVAFADIVVLNKVDRVQGEQLTKVRDYVLGITPEARILETTFGDVPLELVLSVGQYSPDKLANHEAKDIHVHEEGEYHEHEHEHEHNHDHSLVFNTWNWVSDRGFSVEALSNLVMKLPRTIYRAKGFVFLEEYPERRGIVQVTGKRATLVLGPEWDVERPKSQMVVIGTGGGVDAAVLQKLFDDHAGKPYQSRTEQILGTLELERPD